MVQIVIDNANNYVVSRRLIFKKYKHIHWLSLATHYINLIFKDICKLNHIDELARCASNVIIL